MTVPSACGYGIATATARMDWNYLIQTFDLTSNDVGGSSVNSSTKTKYEKMIREGILAINRFYRYKGEE